MTKSDLKHHVSQTGSFFFERSSMKFFGDTMANYGVRSAVVSSYSQENVDCWELYRHRPVKCDLHNSAYFARDNYRRVLPKGD